MQSNDNMQLQQNIVENYEIKNKGFFTLDSLFKENGWHMTKNEMNWMAQIPNSIERIIRFLKKKRLSILTNQYSLFTISNGLLKRHCISGVVSTIGF